MKKLLNSLYILDPTAYLSLDGENIVCKMEDREKFRLPFTAIEDIYCFSYLGCSPALLGKCAEYGVAVSFFTPEGRFLARLQGETRGNIFLRKAQFELFGSPPLILAQNTVAAKLSNSIKVIKRTLKDYPETDKNGRLSACAERLKSGIDDVYSASSHDSLLGIEGNSAKAYFDIFPLLILQQKDDFTMTAQTKRPPLDRVNAMLSFLYTIATYSAASALEGVGLDSYMGFYHAPRPGRNSLACDLVEEFRSIIERLVLTMINLRQINADDFETQVSGAVYLNKEGKRKVLTAWQEKKRTVLLHPALGEKIPLGLLPFAQSTLLAKYVRSETDEYPCFLSK